MNERIQLLASVLADCGLQYAFGVTGSGVSLQLITELERRGVTYYPVFHEASAALMAGAVARITNRVAVSISIKGPGLANMLPGIVCNHFEGHPALSISEAFGDDIPAFRRHKRLDHGALLSSVVKGSLSLGDIDHLPVLLRHACAEVPGPVHLDLCMQHAMPRFTKCPDLESETVAIPELAERVVGQIRNSRRPVLLVGSVATRRPWQEQLRTLSVPVFTTAAAKGVLDESLVHSAGVFTGDGKELAPESHLLQEADLVVGLGLRNSEILSPKPFGRYTIMLDEAGDSFAEGFQPDVLLTDLELVPAVLEALQGKSWGLESLARVKRQLQQALLTGSWLPATCFEVLNALDYPYGMLLDTGSFCTIGEHLWEATAGRFFLGASNSRYMGTAIPSAIGMAVCRPTVPLFCVVGDGGMGMYAAEIKHAIEAQWAICFVLMTDGRYGSVACVPQPQPLSRRAVTVPQPSWWQAIDGMRCEAHLVHSSAAFEKVVLSWRRKGPLFIETRFDPTSYASMTERLR